MSYKLFIDDERFPVTDDWVILRSSQQAINYVRINGCPGEISFDHDLGGEDTSMVFLHWLVNFVLEGGTIFPSDFKYSVHSQNPIGKKNIEGLLDCFIRTIYGE